MSIYICRECEDKAWQKIQPEVEELRSRIKRAVDLFKEYLQGAESPDQDWIQAVKEFIES